MRMTNKIMQNNSLYNINNNKIMQDKLSTMMSTQKKIAKPSDDPVVAIRALRLRTSVSELTQYYEKNAPDAESWLDVTTKALENTIAEVLTQMNKTANKAANKEYGSEDLAVYVEQLKSLRNEFYSTGNLDYAGRYVFTGYRTDTSLTFMKDVEDAPPSYQITEQTTIEGFDQINCTDIGNLEGLNKNNYKDPSTASGFVEVTENDIKNGDVYRLRLSYDVLTNGAPTITYKDAAGTEKSVEGSYPDGNGGVQTGIQTISVNDDPYSQMLTDEYKEAVVFVPETGELLFGSDAYVKLTADVTPQTEFQVTYCKDSWKDGDLRPEHYFACKKAAVDDMGKPVYVQQVDANGKPIVDANGKPVYEQAKDENGNPMVDANGDPVYKQKMIDYNQEYLEIGNTNKQVIEYDVGYNQKIQVNTTADKVFVHGLDRDIDDLERALADLVDIDATMTDLDQILKGMDKDNPDDYTAVKNQYDASKKAYDYLRENIHTMFEGTITKTQKYLDMTNLAVTDNGTRSQRLELISNRLMDQRTNFKTLQSENEDIDIAEVIIQLTSTELTYNSALMATGKIMQTSLMNYI